MKRYTLTIRLNCEALDDVIARAWATSILTLPWVKSKIANEGALAKLQETYTDRAPRPVHLETDNGS